VSRRRDSSSREYETTSSPTTQRVGRSSDGGKYGFLIQRAVEFVSERGGSVDEDELICHVFGSGNPELWRSLLREILGGNGSLSLMANARWVLPGTENRGPDGYDLLGEFVAVDVETTGLQAIKHRVIEVAAIRYDKGTVVDRYETLVQPERRLSKFIRGFTGISDEMLAGAPRFAEIAEAVETMIGSSPILGHNVGFDVGFLNAELSRAGRPTLINDRIDVMGLAMRLMPELRKPSLERLVQAAGLTPRKGHRAGADAEMAAECAFVLAEKARAAGYATVEQFRAVAVPPERRPKDGVGRGRAVLDRSLLADIPRLPGVYIMRDAYERVVYVGKAKCLRDRVSSYYSQPIGVRKHMDGLLESTVRIDVEVTGSELEALLLESQLIKRYQPRYNTVMRSHEEYPFIRVDLGNPWPQVTLAKARKDDGARYFGPFKSKNAARASVDLINGHFPLRSCPRSFKTARSYGAPCIQLDLGKCLGPCIGRANRDEYMAIVRQVVNFLEGDDDLLYQQIWQGLEAAAERLDFERARRLRNDLRLLQFIVASQRMLHEATERHTLLLVMPSAAADHIEAVMVVRGRPWAQFRAARSETAESLAGRLGRSWARMIATGLGPIDHDSVDEANILNRWIARNWGHPAIMPIETGESDEWARLARRALELPDAVLTGAHLEVADEDIAREMTEEENSLCSADAREEGTAAASIGVAT
jgi:DNA polymerase-3 subunit epsilon